MGVCVRNIDGAIFFSFLNPIWTYLPVFEHQKILNNFFWIFFHFSHFCEGIQKNVISEQKNVKGHVIDWKFFIEIENDSQFDLWLVANTIFSLIDLRCNEAYFKQLKIHGILVKSMKLISNSMKRLDIWWN